MRGKGGRAATAKPLHRKTNAAGTQSICLRPHVFSQQNVRIGPANSGKSGQRRRANVGAPKSSTPDVAAKSGIHPEVQGFLDRLTSDPEFKRMNPGTRFVDAKFEDVPAEPPKVAIPLPDPGGKRREKAMTDASAHMLAISNALVVFAAMECGEVPPLENFDEACTSDIYKALAIRSRDLNSAMLAALVGDIDGSELKGLVRFGGSISIS